MITVLKYNIVLFVQVLITMATSDLLETERSSFLGFTHEISMSSSTMELIEQLSAALFESGLGDRRVRRYFEHYDTPFVGERRAGTFV